MAITTASHSGNRPTANGTCAAAVGTATETAYPTATTAALTIRIAADTDTPLRRYAATPPTGAHSDLHLPGYQQ